MRGTKQEMHAMISDYESMDISILDNCALQAISQNVFRYWYKKYELGDIDKDW